MKNQNRKIIEIKGIVGSTGLARGKVKIVQSASKPGIFEKGDILVANVTSPDFVPLMKKSGAIVVDEGGILCHAAIIAREFKKPCVVNTKVATKVLKNNDYIEVDAEKGIIRILNKK